MKFQKSKKVKVKKPRLKKLVKILEKWKVESGKIENGEKKLKFSYFWVVFEFCKIYLTKQFFCAIIYCNHFSSFQTFQNKLLDRFNTKLNFLN